MTPLRDDDVRKRITNEIDRSIFVEASAGTGKTRLLVDRILRLIESGQGHLESIAAITFTEKAAGELRVRLRNALAERRAKATDQEMRQRLLAAERSLDRATVTTIHSFCGQILRERPIEAGITPGFGVLDALRAEQLVVEVWDSWIGVQLSDPASPLRPVFEAGMSIENLRRLALRMIARRDLLLDPDETMPLMAPGEVERLLDDFRAAVRALDEEIDAVLGQCENPGDDAAFAIMTAQRPLVAELRARLDDPRRAPTHRLLALPPLPKIGNKGKAGNWGKGVLTALRGRVKETQETQDAWSAAERSRLTALAVRQLVGLLDAYAREKRERSLLDFDDHLILTRDLLRDHPKVREDLRGIYRHLLVDEFQDTDPLQAEIVCLLADGGACGTNWEEARPEAGRLFLVGDPKQSIYRFRRADIEIYRRTLAVMERSGALSETIKVNFRTRPAITKWVNDAFEKIMSEPGAYSPLDPNRAEPDTGPGVMILDTPGTVVDEEGKARKLQADPRRREEARHVAAWLLDRVGSQSQLVVDPRSREIRPARWGDVAILFRTFTALDTWERVFRAAGVPYHVEGGKHYFRRVEVQALLSLLKAVDDPADPVALVAALRSPLGGFSDDEIFLASEGGAFEPDGPVAAPAGMADFIASVRRWHALRPVESPVMLAEQIVRESRAVEFFSLLPQGDQRVANLAKIVEEARRFEGEAGGFRALIRHLEQREAELEDEAESPIVEEGDGGTLSIMSVHKSKGLEFPIVILADLATDSGTRARDQVVTRDAEGKLRVGFRLEGFVGAAGGKSGVTPGWEDLETREKDQESAERDRLLYVATTRARDLLLVPKPELDKPAGLFKILEGAWTGVPRITSDPSSLPAESPAYRHGFRLPDPGDGAVGPRLAERAAEFARFRDDDRKVRELRPGVRWIRPSDLAMHQAEVDTDSEAATRSRETARAIGRVVHRLLELQPPDSNKLDRDALRLAQRVEGLLDAKGSPDPAVESQIERLVLTALAHPLWERARKSSRVVREAALLAADGATDRIEGIADLLFEEGGKLVLVDWKTDALSGGDAKTRAALYEPQIGAYRRALARVAPIPPGEAYLVFLDGGETVPIG